MTESCVLDAKMPGGGLRFGGRAPWTYGPDPVFLVGCPRSGTTWLQGLLGSHPAVYTGPETWFFRSLKPVIDLYETRKGKRAGFGRYMNDQAFYSWLAESFWTVLSGLPEPPALPRVFLEKTPDHFLDAETIIRALPSARFIHLIRDGRSVVSSLVRSSQGWGAHWAPSEVPEALRRWVQAVEGGQALGRRLPSSAYFEVRYEALREDPVGQLGTLFEWLGAPASSRQLEAWTRHFDLDACRSRTVSQEAWGLYRQRSVMDDLPHGFIGPAALTRDELTLSPSQVCLIESLAGDLLNRLGYDLPASLVVPEPRLALSGEPDLAQHRFSGSVVLVGAGDDPTPILESVCRVAKGWRDEWELLLVSRKGSGCRQAAQHLGGAFRVLENDSPVSTAAALLQGARAANSPTLLLPENSVLLRVPARSFRAASPAALEDPELLEWLRWHAVEDS